MGSKVRDCEQLDGKRRWLRILCAVALTAAVMILGMLLTSHFYRYMPPEERAYRAKDKFALIESILSAPHSDANIFLRDYYLSLEDDPVERARVCVRILGTGKGLEAAFEELSKTAHGFWVICLISKHAKAEWGYLRSLASIIVRQTVERIRAGLEMWHKVTRRANSIALPKIEEMLSVLLPTWLKNPEETILWLPRLDIEWENWRKFVLRHMKRIVDRD